MQHIDLAIPLQIRLLPKAKLMHDFDINLKVLSGNFRKKLTVLIQERTKILTHSLLQSRNAL